MLQQDVVWGSADGLVPSNDGAVLADASCDQDQGLHGDQTEGGGTASEAAPADPSAWLEGGELREGEGVVALPEGAQGSSTEAQACRAGARAGRQQRPRKANARAPGRSSIDVAHLLHHSRPCAEDCADDAAQQPDQVGARAWKCAVRVHACLRLVFVCVYACMHVYVYVCIYACMNGSLCHCMHVECLRKCTNARAFIVRTCACLELH